METIKKTLASGKELSITIGSFSEAKSLWMAINKEAKDLNLNPDVEIDSNLIKDIFCTANSSKEIDEKLSPLLKRCIYDEQKLTDDVFRTSEAREDYLEIVELVALENLRPFVKGLVRKYKARFLELMSNFQKLKQQKPTT